MVKPLGNTDTGGLDSMRRVDDWFDRPNVEGGAGQAVSACPAYDLIHLSFFGI